MCVAGSSGIHVSVQTICSLRCACMGRQARDTEPARNEGTKQLVAVPGAEIPQTCAPSLWGDGTPSGSWAREVVSRSSFIVAWNISHVPGVPRWVRGLSMRRSWTTGRSCLTRGGRRTRRGLICTGLRWRGIQRAGGGIKAPRTGHLAGAKEGRMPWARGPAPLCSAKPIPPTRSLQTSAQPVCGPFLCFTKLASRCMPLQGHVPSELRRPRRAGGAGSGRPRGAGGCRPCWAGQHEQARPNTVTRLLTHVETKTCRASRPLLSPCTISKGCIHERSVFEYLLALRSLAAWLAAGPMRC